MEKIEDQFEAAVTVIQGLPKGGKLLWYFDIKLTEPSHTNYQELNRRRKKM